MSEIIRRTILYARKKAETLSYLFFGALTTIVNTFSFWIFFDIIKLPTAVAVAIAWIISVLFAYVTNRRWVFKSIKEGKAAIVKEAAMFFAFRIVSLVIDLVFVTLLVDVFGANAMVTKILSNVLIVIVNYVFSKFFIFK